MKLKITPSDGTEGFETEVTRHYGHGSNISYKITNKMYKGFQFDDSDRPSNYLKEYVGSKSFHGFLIPRKGYYPLECYIKVIE